MEPKGSIKEIEQRRKEVYKPILDNPYTQGSSWPSIDKHASKLILEHLIQTLSGYGNYVKMKKDNPKSSIPEPAIGKALTLGFNSTVQRLEEQARPNRMRLLRKKETSCSSKPYVKYVFVAKSDISSSLLTEFFPLLAYTASKSLNNKVKLVELPKGSTATISRTLHLPDVSFVSITEDYALSRDLISIIDSHVNDVDVPWLHGLFSRGGKMKDIYKTPNVRFVRTTVPIGRVHKKKTQKKMCKKEEPMKR